MEPTHVIGADIGGTHITAALVDLEKCEMLPETMVREHVDSHSSVAHIIGTWAKAIREVKGGRPVHQVSLAMPGPMDYEEGICLIKDQAKYDNLYGLNIRHLLGDELGIPSANIFMMNDAASFLKGEVFGGAAKGAQNVIGVTLGTGLGTAKCKDDKAISCDLWDLPFKDGIAEDYLSTRWFVKRCYELSGKTVSGVSELKTLSDNQLIRNVFSEFGQNLGQFLVRFSTLNSPGLVVLGGNISKSIKFFEKEMLTVLHANFPGMEVRTAKLGEEAALLGAASYWKPAGLLK